MKQIDPFLQSLNHIDRPTEALEIDVSARVIQTLRERAFDDVASRAVLPTTAVLACAVALVTGVLAIHSYTTAVDPISSAVSPLNVSLQW